MADVMNQLRQLRPPPVSEQLTNRVLLRASAIIAREQRPERRPRERVFAVLVAAVSLAHAVWTVAFMNGLAH